MANMSYCRFENTVPDFVDCTEHIEDALTEREDRYRRTLINGCADVFDMLGVSYDRDALEDAMQRLKRRAG